MKDIRDLTKNNLNNFSPMDGRFGFWGTVADVHPETNRVDILMDIGIYLPGIPVGMNDYVRENKIGNVTFYSGKVDLPARESYVFCLTPNGSLTSAFVLCSGIPYGNSFSKKFFSSNDTEKDNFPLVEKKTDQEGWTITKKKDTGNLFIENVDKSITFELCREDDKQDSDKKKGVRATFFGSTFDLKTESGKEALVITGPKGGTITIDKDKKITLKGNSGTVEIT